MNSKYYTNNTRKVITPSARKGIHHNCDICFSKLLGGMGKYGLNTKTCHRITNLPRQQNTSQEGIDEVDHVERNHGNPSSPRANLKKARKNSVDSINHFYSDNSDDENTSQENDSLDAVTDITPERVRVNNSNISNSKKNSPQYLQMNRHSHTKSPEKKYLAENNGSQWKQFLIVPIAMAIIVWCIYNYDVIVKNIFSKNLNNNMMSIYDETKFFNEMIHLGEKYKVTDDSILQIRSGISTVFRRQDTGCFIFTYSSENANFNNVQLDNFMNDISSAAARYLRNESDTHEHVTVDSSKLNMRLHSELIERYKEDVSKTGLMIVRDMDELPAKLPMAFHYYCDEYNPLIKRSAIFFTLNMAKCSDQKSSHTSIEKCLKNKWTAVSNVKILPLLSRVINIVVDITNVF